MNLITRVSMVILLQSDVEKALAFYIKLGLTKIFHIKGRWAELSLEDMKIGLCPSTLSDEQLRSTGLVFEVADMKKFYEEHKNELSFLAEPKEALHGVMVSIKDPGGNIIDLYQPTPEKLKDILIQTNAQKNGGGCCQETESCCDDEEATQKQGCC